MTDHQSLGVNKRCFAALLTDGIVDVKPVEATKQSRALNNDFRWCTIYEIQMLLSRKMQNHFTSQTVHQRNWHDMMKLCETALTWIYIFRLVMMNMRAFPMRAPSSNRGAPLRTSQPPSRHWDGLHGQAPESCDRKVCRARTAGHRLIDDPHPLRSASKTMVQWYHHWRRWRPRTSRKYCNNACKNGLLPTGQHDALLFLKWCCGWCGMNKFS